MTWTACSTPDPPPLSTNAARLVYCDRGNDDERADFGRIIKLSKLEDPNGVTDPHKIAKGVGWLGGYVKRCYPEWFEKKDEY